MSTIALGLQFLLVQIHVFQLLRYKPTKIDQNLVVDPVLNYAVHRKSYPVEVYLLHGAICILYWMSYRIVKSMVVTRLQTVGCYKFKNKLILLKFRNRNVYFVNCIACLWKNEPVGSVMMLHLKPTYFLTVLIYSRTQRSHGPLYCCQNSSLSTHIFPLFLTLQLESTASL